MNTPNKITVLRICLIPLIVFFYLATFIPWHAFIAGILFIAAAATDFLDGYLARKNNQVTDLGKFLDAIADKMLVCSALILLVAFPITAGGNVQSLMRPSWLGIVFAILILCREFAVSALRMVAASKGKVLAAEKSGKYKAAFTFVTLALYFFYSFYMTTFFKPEYTTSPALPSTPIGNAHVQASGIVGIILIVMLGISTLMTLTSATQYFVKYGYLVLPNAKMPNSEKIAQMDSVLVKGQLGQPQQTQGEQTSQKTAAKKRQPAKKSPTKKAAAKPSKQVRIDKNGRPLDELIPRALQMFWDKGWASTTMLQKHLGVGYPRASKIVDQMEELGFISANDGAKTRRVLITKSEYEKFVNQK